MKAKKTKTGKRKLTSYGLGEDFERDLVFLCSTVPKFWGTIGFLLIPELLTSEAAKIIVKACAAIAKGAGKGPDSTSVVVQRIRGWVDKGEHTYEQIQAVIDLFEEVEDEGGASDVDVVAAEMVPILQKCMKFAAGQAVLEAGNADGDFGKVRALLEAVENVGKADVSPGKRLSRDSFAEIAKLGFGERLSTGIMGLDLITGGGIPRGQYWLVQGGTGSGKSMLLTQFAAEGIWAGRGVAYATVGEVGQGIQEARLIANLTGCLVDDIIAGAPKNAMAYEMFEGIAPGLGPITVKWFDSGTTVAELQAWVKAVEEDFQQDIDVIIIDYIDELDDPRAKNEYAAHKYIGNGLHGWAEHKRRWVLSATQARRQEDRRKREKKLDADTTADSQNKPRKCDGMISINPKFDEDDKVIEVRFYTAKFRTGMAHLTTDSLPVDFAHGRIVPIMRSKMPLRILKGGKA